MKESLQQTTEQALQQTLSPLQLQYARTLEMSGAEFEEEIQRALDDNPALMADSDECSLQPLNDDGEHATAFTESSDQMQQADYRNDEEMPVWAMNRGAGNADSDNSWQFEQFRADSENESLFEALRNQLADLDLDPRRAAIAEYLLGEIDENGYLKRSPQQLSNDLTFNVGIDVTADEIGGLIDLIRNFEPAGVGASTLEECLMLQLERINPAGNQTVSDAMAIVSDQFNLFSHKHFDRLAAALDISPCRAAAAVELLRSLNPKPGSSFGSPTSYDRLNHITPDFEVEPDNSGRLTLSINNSVPHLAIETSFAADDIAVERRRDAADALAFIRRKRDEAADFIRAIEMRQTTLWNVMSAILRFQNRFFESGDPADLRPMILRDISDLTGYDLSVISRATTGKYVSTPFGIYPLKFFFNERPKDETDTSSHEILAALGQIIEGEDKRHPLSDLALAAMLQEKGYDIARRTVTKYREKLGLPVARLRREL